MFVRTLSELGIDGGVDRLGDAVRPTRMCDEDLLYDPKAINDRLLLGLKGTMSEAELHFLRARLQGELLAKAAEASWPCACRSAEDHARGFRA